MKALFFLLLATLTLSAENWPRFRGENGRGFSDIAAPTELNQDSLRWSVPLPGPGSSSPVLHNGLLFVTSEDREKGAITLSCLSAETGEEKWSENFEVGDYHLHLFNNTAAASPAVNDDAVVLAWYDGKKVSGVLSAFSHEGKRLWDYEIGPQTTQHGTTIHPVIGGDVAILASLHMEKGYVAAISVKDGVQLWKTFFPGGKTPYLTPLVREVAGGREVLVASDAIGVSAIDLADGKVKWNLPNVFKERCIVTPFDVLAGSGGDESLIAFGCKNGVWFTVRPPKGGGAKPEIAWRMKGGTPYVPTPVSDGKTVYALSDGGILSALEAATGKPLWQERVPANFYASPILVAGKLYALSREGEMFVIDLAKGFSDPVRSPLKPGPEVENTDATPIAADGKIYVRLGARLDCFGGK